VSDRAGDASPPSASLSPTQHQKGVYCPELAPEALAGRLHSGHQWRVPEHVVKHLLIPFIPEVEVCESTPDSLV
jgi:hypothetical protein